MFIVFSQEGHDFLTRFLQQLGPGPFFCRMSLNMAAIGAGALLGGFQVSINGGSQWLNGNGKSPSDEN